MDRKNKITIAIAVALIAGVLVFAYLKYFSALKLGNISNSTEKISEVKVVDGVPKLFIRGKEMSSSAVNVYYYPSQGENHGPTYGSADWTAKIKALVDQAVGNNAKLILLNAWWSDLDKSTSRPKNIGDNFDFAPLDAVFSYAGQKGAYITPIFTLFPFDPDWWLKENNFPPYNTGGKICDFCETDSAVNVYNNASMNSDIAQRDFGGFVEAVVNHYKDNPALAGWDIGVGATGEDGYGPNYIALKATNIDNLPKFEIKAGTYTDYSPFFERKFKEWMKDKYKADQALQTAWSDKVINLASLKIPKPGEMIQSGKQLPPVFPDPTDIFALAGTGKTDLSVLTQKGLDFYEFRNKMRQEDREYYAKLIKKNDPSHILLLNGPSDDLLGQSFDFDGVAFSMFGATDKVEEGQSYFHSTDIARRAVKAGKLAVVSDEHNCDVTQLEKTGECETPDQLNFIEKLGKSVKCAGGTFAPTAGFDGKKKLTVKDWWIPPIWFSDKAMAAAKKINNFDPSGGCACSLAGEIYSENKCDAGSQSGCKWFSKAYSSLCGKQIEPPSGSAKNNATSPCGDGKCDDFEKSSGMCPQDCK